MKVFAERFHDFSMGHRVVNHENKCKHLHGHNYRIHFRCEAEALDALGRVIDFGVIKDRLAMWIEENWDHRMMLWDKDPLLSELHKLVPDDIVVVPFNPTAENIAKYVVSHIGPKQLEGTDVTLVACRIEETRKCSAMVEL